MISFPKQISSRARTVAGAIALFVAGGVVDATLVSGFRPTPAMAPAPLLPIAQATTTATATVFADPVVTVRGEVSAAYGDSFTLKDASGQALVQLGGGDHRATLLNQTPLVAAGQTVTVQGRYDDGIIRARFIVAADGRAWAVGGHGGRHEGERHEGERHEGDQGHEQQRAVVPAPAIAPQSVARTPNAGK